MSEYIPAYFAEHDSISKYDAGKIEHVLAAVAGRYIGAAPPALPVYRVHLGGGFRRLPDCRYDMNLRERLPELENGQFVYVWGKLWSDRETDAPFAVSCYGPVKVYINGRPVFGSNLNDDVFPDRSAYFRAKLGQGWNHLVLEFTAVDTGCGGIFGTGSLKGAPLHVLAPTAELSGCEGWVYSDPQAARWTPETPHGETGNGSAGWPGAAGGTAVSGSGAAKTGPGGAEMAAFRVWHPADRWTAAEQAQGNFSRICGHAAGAKAFAWSKLEVRSAKEKALVLPIRWRGTGELRVYVDGRLAATLRDGGGKADTETDGDRAAELPLRLGYGGHDLVIESVCGGGDWGFELEVPGAGERAELTKPYPVEGINDPWLYLGPFTADRAPQASELIAAPANMQSLFGAAEEAGFWRVDRPEGRVRPFLENPLYGRWNYPLGVTLYGLLKTGEALAVPYYAEYAQRHIELCTALHEYAMWDRERYGAPGINHQLALIDSLDDCGSFGAAMLEAAKQRPLRGAAQAAEHIARYISDVQDRRADGALFRVKGTTDFMRQTMWCDDLYMSTPFLAKYYERTGETAYLEDAAAQFLLYKKRLFQPGPRIMHHVYDFKFDKPNGVPWGRGNGWVVFSLAELLAVMPERHPKRPELLDFFRELCSGFLRLQDERGLWHQVLTDPESYAEASCSSMFVYAFSQGARFGWLPDPEPYIQAAVRGWCGLTRYCIDKLGNVYGVCCGSGYSFNKLYYKEELTWQLNDTHGIGIVLLAGIAVLELNRQLQDSTQEMVHMQGPSG